MGCPAVMSSRQVVRPLNRGTVKSSIRIGITFTLHHTCDVQYIAQGDVPLTTVFSARKPYTMARRKSGRSVDFKPLPQLPLQLEQNADLVILYAKINSVIAQVKAAESRKRKLRLITQTAAVHYTCLKLALNIVKAEESKISPYQQLWQKAFVAVAERADEVRLSLRMVDEAFLLKGIACQPGKCSRALQPLGKASSPSHTPPRRASPPYGAGSSGNNTGYNNKRQGGHTMGDGALVDHEEACSMRPTP